MDPKDPKGQDDVLVNSPELHLPIGKPVKMVLRAKDVNHQFAVPQFRVKMDMVPGMVTYFWLTPTRTGAFDALCEQLCGVAHFAMRGRVVVDEEPAFEQWLATQPTFSQMNARVAGDVEAGKALFATCTACHGEQGQGNKELGAPKLAGQGGWYLAQQLQSFKQGVRGSHENDSTASRWSRSHRCSPTTRRSTTSSPNRLAPGHAPRHQRRRQPRARQEAVRDLRRVPRQQG